MEVFGCVGRPLPYGIQTWRQWQRHPDNQLAYISDEELNSYITQLRQHFAGPKKVARIVGLSGLGKTRLAFETFRPPENPELDLEQQARCDQVAYLNGAEKMDLPNIVAHWRALQLTGILIVDNCNLELHQLLQEQINYTDSKLSLLTLDFSPEQIHTEYPYIKLKPVSIEVIKGILRQAYPELREPDIDRITDFAQGFPKMAVLLAKARLNEEPDIGSVKDDILVNKLLWGRKQEELRALEIISACALFEHLGFAEDATEQRYFVASKICRIDNDTFYAIAQDFIKQGILDKRHRFVRVVPRPLAIRLAADWWQRCSPERARELLLEEMPAGLAEALCDQMSMLQFLPEAQDAVRDLCGDQAPFGQAEVLNSEKGSRLFRSLVEVNPQATVNALEHAFSNWTREQLLQVGPGRRNLVWALEKLCFWKDTFLKAARIMLVFAAAENEKWGNNATNQFLHLFQVFLAGTQAPPSLRLLIVDEASTSDVEEIKILAIKALGRALQTHHFTRSGGVETQGSRAPQEDCKPKLWSEVFDYWRNSLKRLTPLACGDDELANIAREQIVQSLRGLVQAGLIKEIESALIEIIEKAGSFWTEAIEKVKETIYYEGPKIPADAHERLVKLLDIMKPQSIPEQLILLVSKPSWDHVKNENGHYIDLAEKNAIAYAKECATNFSALLKHLEIILQGELRKGFAFGFALGEILNKDDAMVLIKEALSLLAKLPYDKANPTIIGAFMAAIRSKFPDLVENTLEQIVNDGILYIHAINITRLTNPNHQDLNRILRLVNGGQININNLQSFAYGSVLSHLPPEVVISFCDEITKLSIEALPYAFEILYMYSWNEPDKFNLCRDEFRKLLFIPGLLSNHMVSSKLNTYSWQEIANLLLSVEDGDIELAEHITKEIVDACAQRSFFYSLDRFMTPIIRILLTQYRNMAWAYFSEGFLSDNKLLRYHLIDLFEPHIELEESSSGVLSELPNEFLIEWCKAHSEEAPFILAQITPLIIKDNDKWSWHPIAQSVLKHDVSGGATLEIYQMRGRSPE